jgi:UDP-glucose 4-epimerase
MSQILVTGGAGYVGSVCCAELIRLGHSVTVVDDLSAGHAELLPAGAELCRADIAAGSVAALLRQRRFDAVFHFAAKALIPESVVNPGLFFDVNVASSIRMLEMLRAAGVSRFVFSSSAAVYGTPRSTPIGEDHPTDPINAYGATKLMLEQVLRWYASAYGWSVVAFRYFNACGSTPERGELHDPETHILPLLLQTASGRRPYFEIYGTDYQTPDGTCLRDYVHVSDIAAAHLLALRRMGEPGFHAYNIGTGTSYSVRQVCDAVAAITGRKLEIRPGPRRVGDPAVLCASPERLMAELDWKPLRSDLPGVVQSAWQWEQRRNGFPVARGAPHLSPA